MLRCLQILVPLNYDQARDNCFCLKYAADKSKLLKYLYKFYYFFLALPFKFIEIQFS